MTTRRGLLSTFLFLAGAATGGGGGAILRAVGRKPRAGEQEKTARGAAAAEGLALSLPDFEQALRSAVGAGDVPTDMRALYGLNRVRGFLFEPGGGIVVFGSHDPNRPPMEVDDLVVALRNAQQVGPEYDGAPGCTIDPIPGSDPWRVQAVKVFGMPASAPMGARHVAIDYEMKKIAAGLFTVPSAPSLFDGGRSGGPCRAVGSDGYGGTHRFWFTPLYPGRPRFQRDDTGVMIEKPVEVQVQSEEEFLQQGERVGGAPPQPAAQRFAESLTAILAADSRPEYSCLKNDFRLIELAQLLRFVDAGAGRLTYLLREYPLAVASVTARVRGVRRQESGEATCGGLAAGKEAAPETVVRYRRDFRGGVEARINVESSDFIQSGELKAVRRAVLAARPSGGHSAWAFRS